MGVNFTLWRCYVCWRWVQACVVSMLSPDGVRWDYDVCPICGGELGRQRVGKEGR